jgi:hypothetical protein
VIAAVICAALLPLVRFDFNPMHLRSTEAESVATLLDLMRDPGGIAEYSGSYPTQPRRGAPWYGPSPRRCCSSRRSWADHPCRHHTRYLIRESPSLFRCAIKTGAPPEANAAAKSERRMVSSLTPS